MMIQMTHTLATTLLGIATILLAISQINTTRSVNELQQSKQYVKETLAVDVQELQQFKQDIEIRMSVVPTISETLGEGKDDTRPLEAVEEK